CQHHNSYPPYNF
nr:immunoglobulin light chain junction region [Macaca mulatta]